VLLWAVLAERTFLQLKSCACFLLHPKLIFFYHAMSPLTLNRGMNIPDINRTLTKYIVLNVNAEFFLKAFFENGYSS